MRELIQHELDFDKTIPYFKESIKGGNKISELLLKNHDFKKGHFYTLLTQDADLSKLYQFDTYHVLPANPTENIYIKSLNKTFKGERINSIDEEFSQFLLKKTTATPGKLCIFEEVVSTLSSPHLEFFFERKIVYSYRNELFYMIHKKNRSLVNLVTAMKKAFNYWHFLGVITNFDDVLPSSQLDLDVMNELVQNTELIVTSVYDGESYLVWEKH